MRSCWLVLVAGAQLFGAETTTTFKSTVRADEKTGRLVRSIQVRPRKLSTVTPHPEVRQMIAKAAEKHDVDPLLVESVVQVESNYNASAVSHKGAVGLMQLIPATARRFGVNDPFDAEQNLEGGVKYLKYLQQLYKDDRLALAAYNAGEGAVAKYGTIPPYVETQNYVLEVSRRYGKARLESSVEKPVAEIPERRIEQYIDAEGRIHFRMP